MSQADLSVDPGLIIIGVVFCYMIACWWLLADLQTKRSDLYEALGRPTALFKPFSKSTWRLLGLILFGLPELSPQLIRGSLWATRILLATSIWLLVDERPSLLLSSWLKA